MKYLLLLIAATFFVSIPTFADTQPVKPAPIQEKLNKLEKSFDGRIGVYAINTNNHQFHCALYRKPFLSAISNDIGILWSPLCKPIVLAIYTVQNKQNAKRRDDIVASATNIILDEFARTDPCFNALFS